jgi:hypothetical protein
MHHQALACPETGSTLRMQTLELEPGPVPQAKQDRGLAAPHMPSRAVCD